MRSGLESDRDAFFDQFTTQFFSAGDELKVTEEQRQAALELCRLSDQDAALGCMEAFATTDFRDDLTKITVPTLVLHGDSDGTVPLEGSGRRTHEAIEGSELVVIENGPHGINASHPDEFNRALLAFLGEVAGEDEGADDRGDAGVRRNGDHRAAARTVHAADRPQLPAPGTARLPRQGAGQQAADRALPPAAPAAGPRRGPALAPARRPLRPGRPPAARPVPAGAHHPCGGPAGCRRGGSPGRAR